MKKRTWILSMILTIIFAFSSNGYSLQLITVSINPFFDNAYTNSSIGTFDALVTVHNNTDVVGTPTNYLYFQLEPETFLSFNSTSAVSNTWSPYLSSGGVLQLFGPPALAPGTSFSFVMNYTLTGFSALDALASGLWGSGMGTTLWSMNGAATEDYITSSTGTIFGGPLPIESFSTSLVPEPGTVILLGFGLLGLGFFTRRRRSDS